MSELKAEDTNTSKITTEDFDAFFVNLSAKEVQDDRRAQRAAGDLIVDINHANLYFYVDHIRGLGDADGSGGSGSFSGAAIPTNLGTGGGRYRLEITATNANLRLYAQDQTESPIHSYEGTGSASERLVGTYEGSWR